MAPSLPHEDSFDDSDAPYNGLQSIREDGADMQIASLAIKKKIWWRNAVVNLLFIASWFLFAMILSVYNKWMFSPDRFGFPWPLFVTTLHMLVQFVLAASIRTFWPRLFKPSKSPTRTDYGKKAVPTAVATGLDIGLSNLSLKTITLSFYTMCKSSSLIFVLLFAILFRLEHFSWRLVGVIFLIFSGVVLMVATETHFVLSGLILVMTGSVLGGLRWSLTQLLLKNKNMGMDNPAATIYWLSPIMGLTLAIISPAWERWLDIFGSQYFDGVWTTLSTLFFLLAPGVLAFCMVMSEFYIIQRAGVVPMSIAGIAKEVTTIMVSAWFFGDQLTPLNITGVGITVCGIALFTYHKYRKSMNSSLRLDIQGNPIQDDDVIEDDVLEVELGETERLTSASHVFPSDDEPDYSTRDNQLLFSADHDEDEGLEDVEESRSTRSLKGPVLSGRTV